MKEDAVPQILHQEVLQADVVHQEEKNNRQDNYLAKPVSNACRFF
jgi:hypothetical protein